jgi:hypothetical protein
MLSHSACASAQISLEDRSMVIKEGHWVHGTFKEEGIYPRQWSIYFSEEDIASEHLKLFLEPVPIYTWTRTQNYLVVSYSPPDAKSFEDIACMGFSFNNAPVLNVETFSKLTQITLDILVIQDNREV